MNCEELILSVIVILLMMFLIAYVCTCRSARSKHAKHGFSDKPTSKPNLMWGGVPLQPNSIMDHGNTGMSQGRLPVPNSKTAIRRLQAETVTPPWSSESDKIDEKNGDYAEHFLSKRSAESKGFSKRGSFKNATAIRYMKMER